MPVSIQRNLTNTICSYQMECTGNNNGSSDFDNAGYVGVSVPSSALQMIDLAPAGTNTYTVTVSPSQSGATQGSIYGSRLIAFEY